jgi:hypothetical protein
MQWSLNQGEAKRGQACISAILFNPSVMARCFAVSVPICPMGAIIGLKITDPALQEILIAQCRDPRSSHLVHGPEECLQRSQQGIAERIRLRLL